ncbi:MAG TPA: hypothetical protein VH681_11015 [Nitrospiraceae bacterium]|jgi:hypothetical protein
MDTEAAMQVAEIRISYRYAQAHPWVVPAITGFLSAYFMEQPGFRVQRHIEELETGMHVWVCDIPATMQVPRLLKRLQADIPSCSVTTTDPAQSPRLQYVIDLPNAASVQPKS